MTTARRLVLSVSDAAAGNRRQSEALANAVARLIDADCAHQIIVPHAPWRWFAPRCLPSPWMAFDPAFCARRTQPPALVVGCGRQAALATRLLQQAGSRSVQILNPRIATRHYGLVIAPEHDGVTGDNVITTLGSLNPIDDDWLAQARERSACLVDLPSPRILLALGGPSAAYALDRAEFHALALAVDALLDDSNGSLLLTSSRRTPPWLIDAARTHFAGRRGRQWFSDSQAADNPYPGFLAQADLIVATPDSVNLLSEAAASGTPLLSPQRIRLRGKLGSFRDALMARGLLQSLPSKEQVEQRRALLQQLQSKTTTAEPLRETARVAAQVVQRLFSDVPD